MHSKIKKIPIVGSLFRIANAYVYEGDIINNIQIAPWGIWVDKIGKKLLFTFILTVVLVVINSLFSLSEWSASDAIISIFPSLLGFGIGVFALLFIIPNNIYRLIQKEKESGNIKFGPEIILVDMGYPLSVFAVVLFWAGVNKLIDISVFNFISKWLFFYGMSMVFELVSSLFGISTLITKKRNKE
ncbi:TPA: hypothetical protein ACWMJN_003791 [Morganella morganii]